MADWAETPFGAFATLQRGADLPVQHRRPGTFPVLASNGIVGFHDKSFASGPGVVTGRSGTIGKPTFVAGPYWPLNTVLWVNDFHGNNARFVYFYFQFFDFDSLSTGTSVPTLNRNSVHSIPISVPKKSEQEKIAALLWKVQKAVEVQDKLVRITRELKAAAMRSLFTRGLRNEPRKETEIGLVPESWAVLPLGALGRIGNGSTPKRTNSAYWQNGTIPWLTSAKVYEGLIEEADEFVTEAAKRECHLPLVPANSLVIAITGQGRTLGNSALVSFDTCVSQHLAYVQFTRNDVVPAYVHQFMSSRYEHLRQIGQSGGSTKGALTCGFLKTYPIPLPAEDEQREIAHILQTLDRKIALLKKKRTALRDLFQTLLHQLMTARIRVHELDIDTSEVAG